jgi:WD40 repeat protein
VVSAGLQQRLQIWSAADAQPLRELLGHTCPVAWLGSARLEQSVTGIISIDSQGDAKLWSLSRHCLTSRAAAHNAPVVDACFGQGGRLTTFAADGSSRTWKIEPQGPAIVAVTDAGPAGDIGPFTALSLHARTRRIAIGHADGALTVHDGLVSRLLTSVQPQPGAGSVRAVAWNADGSMIAACFHDGQVRWLSAAEGQPLELLGSIDPDPGTSKVLTSVSFSSDGGAIVVGTSRGTLPTVTVGLAIPMPSASPTVADVPVSAVAAAPDGSFYAAAAGDGLELTDQQAFGGVLCWLGGQNAGDWSLRHEQTLTLTAVAVSEDARFIAAGDNRGGLHVWDLWAFDSDILGNLEFRAADRGPLESKIDRAALQDWANTTLRH